MTNRDWLNSLTNAEFAGVFFTYDAPIYRYFGSCTDSKSAFKQWLDQEYNEGDVVYDYFTTGVIPTQWISPSVGRLGRKKNK